MEGKSFSDSLSLACYGQSCFYKARQLSVVETFMSCDFNQRFATDDSISGRSCYTCRSEAPFSYGFSQQSCLSCLNILDEIAEIQATNSKSAVAVFYEEACPGVLDSKFNTNTQNTSNGSDTTSGEAEGSDTTTLPEAASEFDLADLSGSDSENLADSTD